MYAIPTMQRSMKWQGRGEQGDETKMSDWWLVLGCWVCQKVEASGKDKAKHLERRY
jgi:hypothetical protein